MTKIKSLSKEINERIARQCLLVLLDDDGSSMRNWLEEEFGDYPTYKLRPDRWVCRFIREATNGRAKLTFDPDRNQAQIMVDEGCDSLSHRRKDKQWQPKGLNSGSNGLCAIALLAQGSALRFQDTWSRVISGVSLNV